MTCGCLFYIILWAAIYRLYGLGLISEAQSIYLFILVLVLLAFANRKRGK